MARLIVMTCAAVAVMATLSARLAQAQSAVELALSVKDNKFDPGEIEAPANTPIKLTVKNLDPKPMEFESKVLRVEKIVTGNGQIVLTIRGQKPGRYEFYDDFHEDTTRGALVVK